MRFQKIVVLMGLLALVVASGCAKPPVAEKAAAENAMNAAVTAGAEQYLTADMEAAKKILAEADNAMTNKKYEAAKKNYVDAQAAFSKASAGIEAAKQAMVTENTTAVDGLEKQWADVTDKAKKLGKKLSKDDKAALAAAEPVVKAALQAAKDANASNPAQAKTQIEAAKAGIDKCAGIVNK